MPTIKKFEDGSELTVASLAVIVGAGAVIGAGLFALSEKYVSFKTKRIMKKYGWPKEAYEK